MKEDNSDVYAVYTIDEGEEISLTEDEFWTLFSGRRLPGMSKIIFRDIKKQIDATTKKRLKGNMVHISKYSDSYWDYMNMTSDKFNGVVPIQKGSTYKTDK